MAADYGNSLIEALIAVQSLELAGLPAVLQLQSGPYATGGFSFDARTVASEVWIEGAADGSSELVAARTLSDELALREEGVAWLLHFNESSPTVHLRQLTLRGVIHVNGSSTEGRELLDLDGCTLVASSGAGHASLMTGGLQILGGKVIVSSSRFEGLSAEAGSAIALHGGMAIARGCAFVHNAAATFGGAVLLRGGSLRLDGCNCTGNRAAAGGALYVSGGEALLTDTILEENTADSVGGGIRVVGGAVVLGDRTMLRRNVAGGSLSSIAFAAGNVAFALPAPAGRWVSSGFKCTLYRYPCPSDAADCDREAQPPLESQPCDHQNPILNGKIISVMPPGNIETDFPFACAPGLFGAVGDVQGQSSSACSGPCPAGAACSGATVTPVVCPETTYCPMGSPVPTPCPEGFTNFVSGARSAEECVPCPRGHFCSSGKRISCGLGTFNEILGADDQSFCKYCPANANTLAESTSSVDGCICNARHFADSRTNGRLSCEACPVGARCTEPGTRIETLPLLPGYYRTSHSSVDLRRCPDFGDRSGCIGGVGEGEGPCKLWLKGPYCRLCNVSDTSRYYDSDASACVSCEGEGLLLPVLFCCVAVIVIAALALFWKAKRFQHHQAKKRWISWLSRLYAQLALRAKGDATFARNMHFPIDCTR